MAADNQKLKKKQLKKAFNTKTSFIFFNLLLFSSFFLYWTLIPNIDDLSLVDITGFEYLRLNSYFFSVYLLSFVTGIIYLLTVNVFSLVIYTVACTFMVGYLLYPFLTQGFILLNAVYSGFYLGFLSLTALLLTSAFSLSSKYKKS